MKFLGENKLNLLYANRYLIACITAIAVLFTINILNSDIRRQMNLASKTSFLVKWSPQIEGEHRLGGAVPSPWENVPHFELYIRMSSSKRFMHEFSYWFVKGFRQNYPPERWYHTVVLGMDDENPKDHEAGLNLSSTWPFPRIYYHTARDEGKVYLKINRYRGFWDQFHPEDYIKTEYVGYADTDTLFSTTVTPGSLFEDGKPVIIGRIGHPGVDYWPKATQYLLGHLEATQCMAYFPVIIKVRHVIELRHYIAKRFKKPFYKVFPTVYRFGFDAMCQFSVMCNYVWYYHRDEYVFRFQLSPDNKLVGLENYFKPGMESYQNMKLFNERHPERWLPKPRIAIHGRHIKDRKMKWIGGNMDNNVVAILLHHVLRESFCYIVGFDYLPDCCKAYNRTEVSFYLYQFEHWMWSWHEKALQEQNEYLNEARQIVEYQRKKGLPLFGFDTTEYKCPKLIDTSTS